MPVTMSTLSSILKEVYESGLREQINNETTALKRIVRTSGSIDSNVGGKYSTFPILYGRNGGIGARNEMEDLPSAGHQTTAAARVKLKYQYGSIALSGQALKLADTNTQAFLSALELETQGLKTDLAKNLNQQVYRDGSGKLSDISAGDGTTTVTVSNPDVFDIGTIVDTYSSGSVSKTGLTVTGWDRSAGTITLDATTASGDDAIYRAGSKDKEWTGLDAIVSTSGTLYNIDPTSVPVWKGIVDTSGSPRALSEGKIIENVDAVRRNGGKTSLILTTLGVRASYFALLSQQRKFVNTSRGNQTFEGGFTGLAFTTDQGEVPIVSDVDCPKGTMWGLSEKNLKVYRESDWSFMNQDGNMWVRIPGSVAGTWKDGYSATMFQYSELGTDRRNVHFKIENLSEAY